MLYFLSIRMMPKVTKKSWVRWRPRKKVSLNRELVVLMAVDILRYIMNIFYGPFLAMYFFKISFDSVTPISIYYIITEALVGILPLVLGCLVKKRFQIASLRLGIIVNFAYILFIMVMQENIVNHLGILAMLFGVSTALYYYPHNMLNGDKIDREHRDNFELTKKVIVSIAGVAVPFLLGLFITATDFALATAVIVGLSAVQIVSSFFLKPIRPKAEHFTPVRSFRTFMKDAPARQSLIASFWRGMTTSDSAMQVMTTLLIYNSFQTDLNLGIITSVTNLLLIPLSFLYLKNRRMKNSRLLLASFALIPLFTLGLFLLFQSDLTLVVYCLCYNLAVGILQLIATIRIYNASNRPSVKRGNQAEYWSAYELFQGGGRTLSFVLLLVAGLLGQSCLYGLYVVLSLILVPLTYYLWKIRD